MYERIVKRIIDIILSGLGILVLSPLFLIVAIAIKIDSKGPVFFKQKRVGKNKTHFNIIKFRTMSVSAPHDVPTHQMDASGSFITRVGKFLRKTSLDEIPQLFNIFAGHMAIIGPRPALYNQYDLIEERDKYGANSVKPGLTGWAQINGRDELPIPVKARFDGEYVEKQSFFFDLRCFIGTVFSVFKSDGIKEGGYKEGDGKKKILVVCQYYYPEPVKTSEFCEELYNRGNDVYVLTGVPNYPQGYVYRGYENKEKRDEVINGVKVHRVKHAPRKKGAINRFLNYISFSRAACRYVKKYKERFDLIYVYQLSPVMMAKAALKYKKKHKTPVYIYCLDLWPASLLVGGVKEGSFIYKHYRKVSEKIYRAADKIFVSSAAFSEYFEKEFGIKNTVYLPQYAESGFNSEDCKKPLSKSVDLMFAGNVGAAQGVDLLVSAAALVKDKDVKIHIVGDGSELNACKKIAEEKGIDNVIFYGKKPSSEMATYYRAADVMIVSFKKGVVAGLTLPRKMQTYMAAAKPILAVADGEVARVIKKANCGYVCSSEDIGEIASVIEEIAVDIKTRPEKIKDFSDNAQKFYKQNFSKEKFFKTLADNSVNSESIEENTSLKG